MGRRETNDAALVRTRQLHAEMAQRSGVSWPVRLWDGSSIGPPDAPFRVVLNHPWAVRGMLLPPSDLAAGEAYVLGDIDVEGDMVAALTAANALAEAPLELADRAALARRVLQLPTAPQDREGRRAVLRGRRHGKARDRRAISFHYDLPQAFYEAFLDEALVYSCALFADGDHDLASAQRRKLDLVCRKLRLRPGMRMLDIGCGWGSLLEHAAVHYGVEGLGVSLSETQVREGNRRLARRGLQDRVELRLQDYRDVEGQFDAVASIGMVEHVGAANLGSYMRTARSLLVDGGSFLCHGIVTNEPEAKLTRRRKRTFISTYVFPDGELTPAWRNVWEAERAGFELFDVEQLRPNYALTLRAWVDNLERNRAQAVAVGGETAYRVWRAYMAGSAVAFEQRRIGVVQLLCGKNAKVPLGRAWMLPTDQQAAHSR